MDYLAKMKETEFKILKYIANVCDENNVEYHLYYGTLLGAVRHKGFIPWDDDIDIVMTRENYERFKKLVREDNNESYKLINYDNVEQYPFIFPKVIYKNSDLKEDFLKHIDFEYGLYVDVFILEGLPKNEVKRKLLALRYRYLYTLVRYYYYSPEALPGPLRLVLPLFRKLINVKNIQMKLDKLYSKYATDNSDKCKIQNEFYAKDYVDIDFFKEYTMLEFEGEKFKCPKNYDKCLTIKYGDYMRLPDEKDRVSNHTIYKLAVEGENFEVKK